MTIRFRENDMEGLFNGLILPVFDPLSHKIYNSPQADSHPYIAEKKEVPMDIGMLWYDDKSNKTLAQKVAEAVEYYKNRYGATPTVCYVHPKMLKKDGERIVGKVTIRPLRMMMINHFWLGVSELTAEIETRPREREADRLIAGVVRRRRK